MGKKEKWGWMDKVMTVIVLTASSIALAVSGNIRHKLAALEIRIPNNDQPIATKCYVREKLGDFRISGKPKYDGYFFDGEEKVKAVKLDESNTEIKVEYEGKKKAIYFDLERHEEVTRELWVNITKWLPKDEFYPYYTLNELSEKVNELLNK